MIIVTGGAGFIGSALVWYLNQKNIDDILIVDNLGKTEKWKNLVNLKFIDYIEKDLFLDNLYHGIYDDVKLETVYHLGACSSTQEQNASYLVENNYEYTKILAEYCCKKNVKFIYASSAATYGDGAEGYSDKSVAGLKPLNMYGYSKHIFDTWAIKQGYFDAKNTVIGIKFFNVYGPNENHKAEMRSVINKAYSQIKETGKIALFKSYKPEYGDGEQLRDFIYVKDAVSIVCKLAEVGKSGIYNVGTGQANSWNRLAGALFMAMNIKEHIEYIEMPDVLQGKYQYFTEADMSKTLRMIGAYDFYLPEDAVSDYVKNYLAEDSYLGAE
ncbi:MAG: ADP-glyceromanno-heptose 6-epimerase [bacterium]|nr:ADP-glyceromanno-heptose 6-epimerase [bacterium]